MKKIAAQDYEKLFSVSVDSEKRAFTAVGLGENGAYLLVESEEYNLGSAYDVVEQYYELSLSEVKEYAKEALAKKCITTMDYAKIMMRLLLAKA
ncbi:MAG: hypothetical protein K6G15_10790 [Desulfovibrio sp.]|nr:hypothetical protein [Desulfovibrio sp.]